MCGLLGEFSFSETISDSHHFKDLLELSKHRGPDAKAIYRQDYFQLGFNRLSILDISPSGNQPMFSPSGRYVMVMNGEVYNYLELRSRYELQGLHSTADSAVVVHLLDKFGVFGTLEKLNGMFAISIIDREQQKAYLTRDFAGIKPLFYAIHGDGVVFASQMDQIIHHGFIKNDLTLFPEGIKDYFGLGYMQAPNTIFKEVKQVLPGECISVDKDGILERTVFGDIENDERVSERNNIEELEKVLSEAVRKQLISDVPISSFLSGGIDSPLICSLAHSIAKDLSAFTLEVKDPRINESEIANAYANAIGINHETVTIPETELLALVDEHFASFSEPFGDYSSIPTYAVTKYAKKRYTVMLSGDGGDELFWGYPRFYDVLSKRHWFFIPYVLRKPLTRLLNRFKIISTWAPYHKSFSDFLMGKHLQMPLDTLNKSFRNIKFTDDTLKLFKVDPKASAQDISKELMHKEFYGHLQRVLIKVDRTSMRNSLEVRVPFLDKKVIASSFDFDYNHKSKESDLKWHLKKLLGKRIPSRLLNHKKKGFSVPIQKWLKGPLREDVLKVIFDRPFYGNDVFDTEVFRNYVDDFYHGRHTNAWGVWHIYAWQKWALSSGLEKNEVATSL